MGCMIEQSIKSFAARHILLLIIVLGTIVFIEATVIFSRDVLYGGSMAFMQGFIASKPTTGAETASVGSRFIYPFDYSSVLEETSKLNESWSPYFWVNSGAKLVIEDGVGKTLQGKLPASSPWVAKYAASNPRDTDNGYQPQNIFRLITRSQWEYLQQEVYVKIMDIHPSTSSNANASNGVFLYNRFQNGDNTYYAGLRLDGSAVIKKKYDGVYYTMGEKQVYPAGITRNVLPLKTWVGLRSVITTDTNNHVHIKLYVDNGTKGDWTLVLDTIDDGKKYGGSAITTAGYAGIRTDFMDAHFDTYKLLGSLSKK
jgi:hypothetical protein